MRFETPVGLRVPTDDECLDHHSHSLVSPDAPSIPLFWFVSAHGGAGASTLSSLMAPAGDAGHAWPEHEKYPMCVLLARSSLSGINALELHLREVAAHKTTCALLGVVLIADMPQAWPKVVSHKWKSIAPLLEAVHAEAWTLPFISELREQELSRLAVWEPGQEHEQPKRFGKPQSITVTPNNAIVQLGEDITAKAMKTTKELRQ